MSQCTTCPDNSYSYEGASSCIPCAEGTAVNENKTFCGKMIPFLFIIQFLLKIENLKCTLYSNKFKGK